VKKGAHATYSLVDMKRTLFLGNGSPKLSFTDLNPPVIREIVLKKGQLFKEAAVETLWQNRGHHLLLDQLPMGVELVDLLTWLDQEAPRDALLLFPLDLLHPSALPMGGAWVPVVRKGDKSALLQYFLLLEMEPLVKGVAIEEGFEEEEIALFLDPFAEKKGAFSLLNLKKERPLNSLSSVV